MLADIRISRERTGRPISQETAMIAAIARAAAAIVAARDTAGFADCGVPVVDPWKHSAS